MRVEITLVLKHLIIERPPTLQINTVKQGKKGGLNTSKHLTDTQKVWASDIVYVFMLLITISICYMLSITIYENRIMWKF